VRVLFHIGPREEFVMLRDNNFEERFNSDLGIDEETAEKFSGTPGGIWYDLRIIIYYCLAPVFIVLFILNLIDLKSFLLLFLIWLAGDLVGNFLHHIFMFIRLNSLVSLKLQEKIHDKIDKILEQL
jgi:hypothetical protein